MGINIVKANSLIEGLQIDNIEDDVKTNLAILLKAISKVEPHYMVSDALQKHDEKQLERVFAYELYYQWKRLLLKSKSKLILNGEIEKRLQSWSENHYIVPDMILHKEHSSSEDQMIVCEIKRNKGYFSGEEYSHFARDFEKLSKMSCTKYENDEHTSHNFKMGVFVLSLGTLDDLNDIVAKTKLTFDQALGSNVVCITYNLSQELGIVRFVDLNFSNNHK